MTSSYGASALKSSGPSLSMVENNVTSTNMGVGNYKGVMLCNRPFGGITGNLPTAVMIMMVMMDSLNTIQ